MLGDSLGYTNIKVLGYDEGIKMVIFDGKAIFTILVRVDGIKLGLDIVTDLGHLYGSFDDSNDGMVEGS